MSSFGLTLKQRKTLELLIKTALLPGQSVSVWIFGSRSRGDHRKNSDVDLLLQGEPDWSDKQVNELREALEESDFPYKVDLIREKDLFPAYREAAFRERKLLWESMTQS